MSAENQKARDQNVLHDKMSRTEAKVIQLRTLLTWIMLKMCTTLQPMMIKNISLYIAALKNIVFVLSFKELS